MLYDVISYSYFFVFFKSEITQSYSFADLLHTLFHTLKQNTSSAMVMSWVAYPFTWCDWFVSSLRRLFIIPFNRYFIYINHSRQRKEHQKGGGTSFLAHSPSLVYRASNNFPPENFVPPITPCHRI